MPLVDILVMSTLLLGGPTLAVFFRRRGVRGLQLLATWWTSFVGLIYTVTMLAHCIDIAQNAIRGNQSMRGELWTYDWRLYSLLLFGVVLMGFGVRFFRGAFGLSRGDGAARKEVLQTAVVVLAIVAPVIPIHGFFAYPLTVFALLTLLIVGLGVRTRVPVAVAS